MKQLLLFTSLFMFGFFAEAQYINNGGFETWGTGDPTGWNSPNSQTQPPPFSTTTVTKETVDVHGGLNSAKLETKAIFGYPIPGILTNGIITVAAASTPPVTITGGVPFTQRPGYFTGFYKYTAGTSDICYISVFLLKRNGSVVDTIGYAQFTNNTTVSTWTSFTAPFNYSSVEIPDTMQVLIISSNPSAPVVGSILKVDDLNLTGGTLGITKYSLMKNINVFPNPASDLINIQFSAETTIQTIVSVYSLVGQKIKELTLPVGTELSSINIRDLKSGLYFVQIQAGKEKYIQKVSVN